MLYVNYNGVEYPFYLTLHDHVKIYRKCNEKGFRNIDDRVQYYSSHRDVISIIEMYREILELSNKGNANDTIIDNVLDCCGNNGYLANKVMDCIAYGTKSTYTLKIINKEDNNMPYRKNEVVKKFSDNGKVFRLTKIVTHNERVVIVYFDDGSFTKAVCSEKDHFDLDVGIQVCFLKKMLGVKNYYSLLKDVHNMMDKEEEMKKKAAAEKKERRDRQNARAEKNRIKKQNAIDTYKQDITEAVLNALDIHKNSSEPQEDDLK